MNNYISLPENACWVHGDPSWPMYYDGKLLVHTCGVCAEFVNLNNVSTSERKALSRL